METVRDAIEIEIERDLRSIFRFSNTLSFQEKRRVLSELKSVLSAVSRTIEQLGGAKKVAITQELP